MMRFPLTLTHILDRCGQLHAKTEIATRLPDGAMHRYTYADLHRRALAFAAALLRAGLKRGERVGTLMWNHYAHLEAYFAIPIAGGVVHTLNVRLHPNEIAVIVNHAADRILVVDDVLLPLFEQFRDKVDIDRVIVVPFGGAHPDGSYVNYEEFISLSNGGSDVALPLLDEWEAAAMSYTSGTTGKPKGVAYSHRALVLHAFMLAMADTFAVSQRDVVLPIVPMFHGNAWGFVHAAVMVGAKQVFPGRQPNAEIILELFAREGVTFSAGVPTVLLNILEALERDPTWSRRIGKVRIGCGGSAPSEALIRKLDTFGLSVIHAWGMTETTPVGVVNFIKSGLESLDQKRSYEIRALQGLPVPFVDIRLCAGGSVAPWDDTTPGELEVRGPWVSANYFDNPGSEDRWTDDGWFKTGDIATINQHGYVRITDRAKDLIKSGGEWISSVDLENALTAHPAVAEAAVIAVPHPKWQERPLAIVVLKGNARATSRDLAEHLADKFAKWQLPDGYIFAGSIPHTSVGKADKKRLRMDYRNWKPEPDLDRMA
jgi:fatty-acyl-CoA synthase